MQMFTSKGLSIFILLQPSNVTSLKTASDHSTCNSVWMERNGPFPTISTDHHWMSGLVWEHSPTLGWTLTRENSERGQDDETGVGYCGNQPRNFSTNESFALGGRWFRRDTVPVAKFWDLFLVSWGRRQGQQVKERRGGHDTRKAFLTVPLLPTICWLAWYIPPMAQGCPR